MHPSPLYPRFAEPRLIDALQDTPVVLIHGPRQCGKTTLARMVGSTRGYSYYTFDDEITLAAAIADPVGFVADLPDRTILDEVQRAPGLFTSIKTVVDRQRTPGRFILTGSANVLLLPSLADSLAGRMEIMRLFPLAQCELANHSPAFLDTLFDKGFKPRKFERLGLQIAEKVTAGGFPEALRRTTDRRRLIWYRDYIETLVQRDIRNLAHIRSLDAIPRLLTLAAGQTARLLNISDLASPFQLTRQTIHEYVTLLERIFLVDRLAPWHINQLSRLVKTPKMHMGDTGIVCALLGLDATTLMRDRSRLGQMLETFVYQELRRQASVNDALMSFYHFRDRDDAEVDIVIERGAHEVAGIEIKAAASVTGSDFRGLRKLRDLAGDRFVAGVILYDGESSLGFGEGLFAVPIRSLWEI